MLMKRIMKTIGQVSVVWSLDNAIHQINHCPLDKCKQNIMCSPTDRDLSSGYSIIHLSNNWSQMIYLVNQQKNVYHYQGRITQWFRYWQLEGLIVMILFVLIFSGHGGKKSDRGKWVATGFAIVFFLTTVIMTVLYCRQRRIYRELEGDSSLSRLIWFWQTELEWPSVTWGDHFTISVKFA